MSKKLSTTQKLLLVNLIVGIIGVASLAGVLFYLRTDSVELKDLIHRFLTDQANKEKRIEITNLYEDSMAERGELGSYMLEQSSLIDFISEIEDMATKAGLQFETRSVEPDKAKKATFGYLTLGLTFSGEQERVLQMVRVLEELPYHGHINRVLLQKNGEYWNADVYMVLTLQDYDK